MAWPSLVRPNSTTYYYYLLCFSWHTTKTTRMHSNIDCVCVDKWMQSNQMILLCCWLLQVEEASLWSSIVQRKKGYLSLCHKVCGSNSIQTSIMLSNTIVMLMLSMSHWIIALFSFQVFEVFFLSSSLHCLRFVNVLNRTCQFVWNTNYAYIKSVHKSVD